MIGIQYEMTLSHLGPIIVEHDCQAKCPNEIHIRITYTCTANIFPKKYFNFTQLFISHNTEIIKGNSHIPQYISFSRIL